MLYPQRLYQRVIKTNKLKNSTVANSPYRELSTKLRILVLSFTSSRLIHTCGKSAQNGDSSQQLCFGSTAESSHSKQSRVLQWDRTVIDAECNSHTSPTHSLPVCKGKFLILTLQIFLMNICLKLHEDRSINVLLISWSLFSQQEH